MSLRLRAEPRKPSTCPCTSPATATRNGLLGDAVEDCAGDDCAGDMTATPATTTTSAMKLMNLPMRASFASDRSRKPHACQDATHIGKAADHSRHRIVGMNLIFQIDEAPVLCRDEGFKHPSHRHDAVSDCDLLSLFSKLVRSFMCTL